jgi:hypothetical protein
VKAHPLRRKFLPVFSVQLMHPYYTDGRCPDFDIEPTQPTQRLLTNARCLLKAMSNGIRVLRAVTDEHVPLIALPPNTTLTFCLRLLNSDFPLFTDLTAIPQTTPPLSIQVDVSRGEAMIQIDFNDSIPLTPTEPYVFDITFTAKQARWIYYVITDQRRIQSTWQIVNTEMAATAPLTFSAANCTNLAQHPDPTDTIATLLAAQYRTMQRWRFMSDAPTPCRQAGRQHLQLVRDGQTVWGALPNPSLHNYTTVAVHSNGTMQPQDALFHILPSVSQSL